jgi:acetylglutamate kinase
MTMTSQTDEWMEKAGLLIEALPYMRRYSNKPIVVKFGGHAMDKQAYVDSFSADMTLLRQIGAQPVVVHGGGPQIGDMLKRLKIESNFINGLRVTDAATISVVEMVLAGAINKSLVAAVNMAGGRAVGLSGKDGHLITASKLDSPAGQSDSQIEKIDLGFVGRPETVDPTALSALMAADMIPVIAPIGSGVDGQTYNINADTAAGAVAGAIGASRLLMLTDVAGVKDKDGGHISHLTVSEAQQLIEDGTVQGGMIPKVETCIDAVEQGAEAAVILDGRAPHAVLVELFTEHGIGTLITRD